MAQSKPIIAFDGEGRQQHYILLAASDGSEIHARRGLRLRECLEFITRPAYARTLNIWYSFGYDVNMMLQGINDPDFWMGRRKVQIGQYVIEYLPNKILKVRHGGRLFTHYDVFGFFQTSFRQAILTWLNVTDDVIEAGKAARGSFATWQLSDIRAYNARELVYLKQLGEKLIEIFSTLDIPLKMRSWHGAGAAAQAALTLIKLDQELEADPRLAELAQAAYYGGRVETIQRGEFFKVYHADLRSAYPSAMLHLPNLTRSTWRETDRFNAKRLGVYAIEFESDLTDRLGAFPVRLASGLVVFPLRGSGVYWSPEILAAQRAGVNFKVTRGLVIDRSVPSQLPRLVSDLYTLRKVYRAQADGREKAVKLILNALYGKLAQKVGGRFYSLALAGLVTSWTRARIFEACQTNPEAVIATATDGVFSRAPLGVIAGSELGAWEIETAQNLKIVMNGVYLLQHADGRIEAKTRGFNLDQDDFAGLYARLAATGWAEFPLRRFVTHSLHLIQPRAYPRACRWIETTRQIMPEHDVKRAWPGRFNGEIQQSAPLPGEYYNHPYTPRVDESLDTLLIDVDEV